MVVIDEIKMPKNCGECFALDEYGDYPICRITGEQRGYNFDIRGKVMDKCPLREIKEGKENLLKSCLQKVKIYCWYCGQELNWGRAS